MRRSRQGYEDAAAGPDAGPGHRRQPPISEAAVDEMPALRRCRLSFKNVANTDYRS